MTLDLAELARLERILHQSTRVHLDVASAEETARQIQALLWEHRPALLAAARRLEQLESAMHYIAHNTNVSGQTFRLSYDGMTAWAAGLGWKATP